MIPVRPAWRVLRVPAGMAARIFKMRRRWHSWLWVASLLGFAGAAILLIAGWPRGSLLEVCHAETHRVVLCARMQAGEEFVLSFTHSVNRRPVYDTLRAEGNHLVIVKSRFDTFGAGMPEASTAEGTLAVTGDGWLEWTVNRPVPEVTIRVGRVAEHALHIRGREIRLADLAEPGVPLTLHVRNVRILDLLKGRCMP